MSRKNEDFDEFCDPDHPKIINFDDIQAAADRIKPYVINSPCTPSKYQKEFCVNLYYKPENLQKTGSFKERGSVNALQLLPADKKKIGIVVASIGNDAAGFCYHGAKMNIPVVVVMPNTVPLMKLQYCHALGAKVILQGGNLFEAQKYARAIARDKGLTYINGRDHPHILAGYGTVALEILEQIPRVDAVLIPVGTGGLAAAVATVIKRFKPKCLVYGIEPETMPVYRKSLENNDPVPITMAPTMADAIAVTNVGTNAFANVKPLMDKLLQVSEDWIARSILHLVEKERLAVEGAGACGLAAFIGNLVPELKTKTVVCILSGGNIDGLLLARCLDRGLAAEGRLVKFHVKIKDTMAEATRLLDVVANGGFTLVNQFQHHQWVDNEMQTCDMNLVVATKGMENAFELKRLVEKAFPSAATFETEPLNDLKTCPCYLRKDC